ncbi:MAG: thrombospondin type 3 repeat-containing protein [Thermomicrobiales bacterium]
MKHSTMMRWASMGSVLALLLLMFTPLLGLAQAPAATRPNDPSPAMGHAQVIAHGVASLPQGDLVWRLRLNRAPLPNRAAPQLRPPSFVAGVTGVVAVSSANGVVTSRVPAGEAVWMPPETPQAVVSLERQPTAFLDFAVERSTAPRARDIAGSAFSLPRAGAYDMVLLRDVLNRGEASTLASVTGPAFLYVSSGRIALYDELGEEIDLAAGDVAEFTGEAVAVGLGRMPATFLVAMIGAETPRTVDLRQQTPIPPVQPTVAPVQTPVPVPTATMAPTATATATPLPPTATATATPVPTATPLPTATPVPTATPSPSPTPSPTATPAPTATPSPTATPTPTPVPGEILIAAAICPAGYGGPDFAAECTDPAAAVPFVLAAGHGIIDTREAGAAGTVRFADVLPGSHQVGADIPGDFASSQVQCDNGSGEEIAQPEDLNQVALDVAAGDTITCDWYIVPENARGLVDLSVLIRACPEGMTPETLERDECAPAPDGTLLALSGPSGEIAPAATAADAWEWSALDPGDYTLAVAALPQAVTDYQLDDQPCCGPDGEFSVDLDGQLAEESRTLYLFQPEPEAPDTSITVDIATCPPGMNVNNLDPAACGPAPAGTSLALFVGSEQLPAATEEDAQWTWRGVPYGTATLILNAVPEGTATFSLNQRTCCNLEGGLDVSVSEETPHTGYILFFYPPESAAPEVVETPEPAALADVPDTPEVVEMSDIDPDGDGLPSTDEAFFQTDPEHADSDGDGVNDAAEIAAGTDPLTP